MSIDFDRGSIRGGVMGKLTVFALRGVIVALLGGSVVAEGVMVPLFAGNLSGLVADLAYLRTPLLVITVLGIVTAQVVLVCVWRLATMVPGSAPCSRPPPSATCTPRSARSWAPRC
jgi:hypothetical protein